MSNVTFVPSTATAGQMLQTGVAIVETAGRYARHHATRNVSEVGTSGPCTVGERISSHRNFNEAARAC